ncbi:energy transducer TonB [Halothiobacillus sp. DCM-1]|uniref:energy transducer TonB family protein n=1 Tax=Halothiobacillus sp. DCM-1 TaxID=3112558 RepID=UPI00324C6C4B
MMRPGQIGFAVSLALHAVALAVVLLVLHEVRPTPAPAAHALPVTLAMFATPAAPPSPAAAPPVAEPPANPPVVSTPPPPQPDTPAIDSPPETPPAPTPNPTPNPTPEPTPATQPETQPATPPAPRPAKPSPKAHEKHPTVPRPKHAPQPPERQATPPAHSEPLHSAPAAAPAAPAARPDQPAIAAPRSLPPSDGQAEKARHEQADQLAAYQAALIAAIAEKKFYPPLAQRLGQEGTVVIALTVEADGRFSDIHLVGTPDSVLLGRGGLDAVEALGRFRPIPPALGLSRMPVQVTLVYKLR